MSQEDEAINLDFSALKDWDNKPSTADKLAGKPRTGDGRLLCIRCEKQLSQAGNQMYVWVFTVKTGVYKGLEVKEFTVLKPNAMWKIKQVVEALIGEKITGKYVLNPVDLIGESCYADLEVSTSGGHDRLGILKYREAA